jgi:hypothetical protein
LLAFVTSLRHPQNSAEYARVEELLKTTLDSVTGQTTDEFVTIVVGNRPPAFDMPSRTHFVAVDFPPPSVHNGPRTPMKSFVWDKGTKIGIGLAAARDFNPDYVMIFDADDFVHRDLARFVAENPGPPGWVVDRGYMFSRARNVYRRQPAFNRVCGTCHIVAYDTYAVPATLTVDATQQEVERAFSERMWRIMGAHKDGLEWFAAHGVALEPLPFPGAVYQVDTGENHSGKQMTGVARPLRPQMSATFGIPGRRALVRDVWSATGPRALAGSVSALSERVSRRVTSGMHRAAGKRD